MIYCTVSHVTLEVLLVVIVDTRGEHTLGQKASGIRASKNKCVNRLKVGAWIFRRGGNMTHKSKSTGFEDRHLPAVLTAAT